MNGPVPSKYPQAPAVEPPVNQWRNEENGPRPGRRRGPAKNSNVPTAPPVRGSSFVALVEAATGEKFSLVLRLFRRHPEGPREPFAVMRPDLGIDDPRRALAVERVEDLLGGDAAHVLARLAGHAGGVRARQHIVELEQRMLGRRRFLGPDVETGARDAFFAQSLQQCVLVVDEAAR